MSDYSMFPESMSRAGRGYDDLDELYLDDDFVGGLDGNRMAFGFDADFEGAFDDVLDDQDLTSSPGQVVRNIVRDFGSDLNVNFGKDLDEIDLEELGEDHFPAGESGIKGPDFGYDDGFAHGAAAVAVEIEEALGCERFIDCDCKPHRIIRRVLVGNA